METEEEVTEISTETEEEVAETSTETEESIVPEIDTSTDESEFDVMFIDPYPVTTIEGADYEIQIVHTLTLGDMLQATLITVLIVVVLLSRLLGRSARW